MAFGQDFNTLISQAGAANQTTLNQINTALTATTLSGIQAGAATALATAKTVQSDLQSALAIAPDDASRSRAQGLLNHVNAAIASLQRVATDTTFDTARSDLNAARGEILEAQNEFPAQLPVTGGLPIGPVLGLALVAIGTGATIRRVAGRAAKAITA